MKEDLEKQHKFLMAREKFLREELARHHLTAQLNEVKAEIRKIRQKIRRAK